MISRRTRNYNNTRPKHFRCNVSDTYKNWSKYYDRYQNSIVDNRICNAYNNIDWETIIIIIVVVVVVVVVDRTLMITTITKRILGILPPPRRFPYTRAFYKHYPYHQSPCCTPKPSRWFATRILVPWTLSSWIPYGTFPRERFFPTRRRNRRRRPCRCRIPRNETCCYTI